MRRFRDIKRRARRQLHAQLADSVLFLECAEAEPVSTTVRLHLKFNEIGEILRGGFADRAELTPRIVFLNAEIQPSRDSIVVTQDMGGYFIEFDEAPDDITTTCQVVKMTRSQVVELGWDPDVDWLGLTPPVGIAS